MVSVNIRPSTEQRMEAMMQDWFEKRLDDLEATLQSRTEGPRNGLGPRRQGFGDMGAGPAVRRDEGPARFDNQPRANNNTLHATVVISQRTLLGMALLLAE